MLLFVKQGDLYTGIMLPAISSKSLPELAFYIAPWCTSVTLTIASFCAFDRENYLTLCASLIGVTSLIFNAKGNPFGQLLMVIFSLLYGIISFTFTYYGEMITYLGMTMPMAVFALVAWLKNPYKGNKAEVEVNTISYCDILKPQT